MVSDSYYNICKSIIPQKIYNRMANNVGLTFGVGDNCIRGLQLVLSKTIRIDDAKHHI